MPFISSEDVATIRKAVRAALPEFKVSVTKEHHSSVHVTLIEGPIAAPVEGVNVYWYKEHLKDRPDAIEVVDTILAEIFKVKKCYTEVEDSDYGSVPNFYYHVHFGKWDKPYIQTGAMAKAA
jgi:hypothetical protein